MRFTTEQALRYEQEHRNALVSFDYMQAEYESAVARHKNARRRGEDLPLPEKPRRPTLKRTWVDDCTVEALALRLSENPRGLALIRDELSGFMLGLNQYKGGRGPDQAFFLSAWSGMPYQVDRKSDPDPTILHNPFLSIVGGIQPGILPRILHRDHLESGFAARFLFAYPANHKLEMSDLSVSPETWECVRGVFGRLYAREPGSRADGSLTEGCLVGLTPVAQGLFREYHGFLNDDVNRMSDDDPLRAPISKMPAQLARIALILHSVRWASSEVDSYDAVDEDTMVSAIRLIDYFVSHSRRVWVLLTEAPDERRVRRLLDWIRHKGPDGVTQRNIVRNGVAGIRSSADADGLLQRLEECELIDKVSQGKTVYFLCRQDHE